MRLPSFSNLKFNKCYGSPRTYDAYLAAGTLTTLLHLLSNMAQIPLDGIAWMYISFFIIWNITFVAGLIFLWTHRQLPSLRMRRIPLLLAGLSLLHVYGNLCMLTYPFGAYVPCSFNFWLMSIWLPLGIALFHASNSQFLSLVGRQKQFARMSSITHRKPIDEETAQTLTNSAWRRVLAGLRYGDTTDRTLVSIGIGMVIQVSRTLSCDGILLLIESDSSSLLCSSSSAPRSSILDMVYSITRLRVLACRWQCTVPKGGNGGCPLYGSYSGAGSTHRIFCYGRVVACTMCMAGACKLYAAVLLGTWKRFHDRPLNLPL